LGAAGIYARTKLLKVIAMKKENRIKKNNEFQQTFQRGKSFANRQLVIYHVKRPGQTHFRVGLSVGKKIGNAVTRNRVKRYLRQAFNELEAYIPPEYDMIMIARLPVKDLDYHETKKSLMHLLRKERILKSGSSHHMDKPSRKETNSKKTED